MIHYEWKDFDGLIYKEWGNDNKEYHRESGPALICYYPDGSIKVENFFLAGKLLGSNKEGFWALWERLTEGGRQAPDILKCLARYS